MRNRSKQGNLSMRIMKACGGEHSIAGTPFGTACENAIPIGIPSREARRALLRNSKRDAKGIFKLRN